VVAGHLTATRGLVSALILAGRLQGRDVSRGFFDGALEKLAGGGEAAGEPLAEETHTIFA